MKRPWENRYVYGLTADGKVAHIIDARWPLCWSGYTHRLNRSPKPYPVCRNCLRTKRAKELGLLDRVPNLCPRNEELP